MMIIGQEMADIHHGGGGRTVPFSGFVWSGVFLGDRARAKKFSVLAFLSFCGPQLVVLVLRMILQGDKLSPN
jgi:hypothetical protein